MYNSEENSKIIEERLIQLGDATIVDGGIFRGIYTKEDAIGKEIVKAWIEKAGIKAYEDSIGNIFGRIEGRAKDTILVGSHMDTVKDGGRYDGALGVVTAISSLAELYKKHGKPEKTVEIVGLLGEEGSRYAEGYIGSKAITGTLEADVLNSTDNTGKTLSDAMIDEGYNPRHIDKAIRNDIESYIELHIEQGPILHEKGISIGIVENIVGLAVYEVSIIGKQNHAGTTPMDLRIDPVIATSEAILLITKAIKEISKSAVLTIGDINVMPGMSNVIAKEVKFSIDYRDGDINLFDKGKKKITETLELFNVFGYKVDIKNPFDEKPISLDSKLSELIYKTTKESNISSMFINSGAGHDAQVFAQKVPTSMIFVPSKDGISHSKDEYTSRGDIKNGYDVLQIF